jgi:hypothetical protein
MNKRWRTTSKPMRPTAAQLEVLNLGVLRRLEFLHQNLRANELACPGVVPLLIGKERAAMINSAASEARKPEKLPAQILGLKILLNAMCPNWEAEDPELARVMADRVPPECAWADMPVRASPCH